MIDFAKVRKDIPLPAFVEHVGVPLRKEGNLYRGKCPFHQERRGASLVVYPDARWFCHGKCHFGGDVTTFAQLFWALPNQKEAAKALLGIQISVNNAAPQQLPFLSPKWPKRELKFIDETVRTGIGLSDLYDLSSLRFEESINYAEEVIDIIFPGNPLLCIGKSDFEFATRRRKIWRGTLHRFPLMVPSPMLKAWGKTQSARWSQHTKEATAGRVYLVVEFDFSVFEHNGARTEFAELIGSWACDHITIADACSALLWHLRGLKTSYPFVMAVHSGGKSLHGWFNVFPATESQIWPFMRYAYQIGADHVTWCKSQFIRIPGGTRQDGRHQQVHFLEPSNAVKLRQNHELGSPSQLCWA